MNKVKEARQKAGISQGTAADISGVSIHAIQQYEADRRDIVNANIKTIYALALTYKCNVADLLEDEEAINLIKQYERNFLGVEAPAFNPAVKYAVTIGTANDLELKNYTEQEIFEAVRDKTKRSGTVDSVIYSDFEEIKESFGRVPVRSSVEKMGVAGDKTVSASAEWIEKITYRDLETKDIENVEVVAFRAVPILASKWE